MAYYISLQYSAIQKTVLRHDRLWSIAGTSQVMAWMNELAMSCIETGMSETISKMNEFLICEIDKVDGAKVLVAGGGKFTVRFPDTCKEKAEEARQKAEEARKKIIKLISTTLPMLEFQVSEIVNAGSLNEAKNPQNNATGIIDELNEQKRRFRGYGVTFNPHLKTCLECGEYPLPNVPGLTNKKETNDFCPICLKAFQKARINVKHIMETFSDGEERKQLTTLERIYRKFYENADTEKAPEPKIAHNFDDLFPGEKKHEKGKRMAVWFSDLNNMNQKVPIWLAEEDTEVPEIFSMVKDVNVDIISQTLIETFDKAKGEYMPFRLIVAGGDDLRIVMAEDYILDFVLNLSNILNDTLNKIYSTKKDIYKHLRTDWLQQKKDDYQKNNKTPSSEEDGDSIIKPYSFSGAFAVTSIHTPFRRIHEACEEMMSSAKEKTDRMGNSVNWSVLSVEEASSHADTEMQFDKPSLLKMQIAEAMVRIYLSEPIWKCGTSIQGSFLALISSRWLKKSLNLRVTLL